MRIACLYIPRFYIQVERVRYASLIGRPVVIGGLPEEKACVVDCSEEAAARGVYLSMSLREAYHFCPEAAFLVLNEGRYRDLWEEILYALGSFALRMESNEHGVAYLDITKSMKVHGGEESLAWTAVRMLARSFRLEGKAGVGNSRFIALQAAVRGTPVSVIRVGMENKFLSGLSVNTLPIGGEVKERLRLLGLTSLGKLTSLSCEDLSSQFGSIGTSMWKVASGADDSRQILKRRRRVQIEREVVVDAPLETAGQLEEAVGRSLEEIVSELRETGRSCRKLRLVLYIPNREHVEATVILKKPADSKEGMLSRVMNTVPCMILGGPISGFRLSVSDLCKNAGEQESLFRKRHLLNEKLEGVKGYLTARYGESPLFKVEEGEKDTRLPERRYVFKKV